MRLHPKTLVVRLGGKGRPSATARANCVHELHSWYQVCARIAEVGFPDRGIAGCLPRVLAPGVGGGSSQIKQPGENIVHEDIVHEDYDEEREVRESVVLAALLNSQMGWVFMAVEMRRPGDFRWTPKAELYDHSGWRVCLARRLRRPWGVLK